MPVVWRLDADGTDPNSSHSGGSPGLFRNGIIGADRLRAWVNGSDACMAITTLNDRDYARRRRC